MRALAEADFVISVVPANDNTKHLFNEQKFQKMKSTSYFINVGRGAVVDEQALLDALKSQEVCSAFFLVASVVVHCFHSLFFPFRHHLRYIFDYPIYLSP